MSILTGGSPFDDLIGIGAGHTYIYLKMVLPQSHGYDWLKTPRWVERFVAEVQRRTMGAPAAGNSRVYNLGGAIPNQIPDAGAQPRAFAGRGVRLGGM